MEVVDKKMTLLDSFKLADNVLGQGVQGISDLITVPGLINVDFADVKTIMLDSGSALMGIGEASGENRASTAARMAISSPLLEVSIDGAKGILYNIIGGPDMTMTEVSDASAIIANAADPDANIIFGATINEEMGSNIKISVIATGFENSGYGTAKRPFFGNFSHDSNRRLGYNPASFSQRPAEPAKIDRAPSGFTQPKTTSELSQGPSRPTSPFVSNQEFKNDQNMDNQQNPANSANQPSNDNDLEDEFEIPAFLRQ
jgi:cell division GTPase FtsZ